MILPFNKRLAAIILFIGVVHTICAQSKINPLQQELALATTYLKQQEQLKENEQYENAIATLQKARAIYKKNKIWKKYIECTINISGLYGFVDKNQKNTFAKETIHLVNTFLPQNDTLLATAQIRLGNSFIRLSKMDSAMLFLKMAVPTVTKQENWLELNNCQYNLAVASYHSKDWTAAKLFIQKGLSIAEFHQIDKYKSSFLNLLSVIHYQEGDFQKAIQTVKKIITIKQKIKNPTALDNRSHSNYLKNLGTFYTEKGENNSALDCYLTINRIYEHQDDLIISNYPNHFNNISKILHRKQKYTEAIKALKKSILFNKKKELTKNRQRSIITSYSELAVNYEKLMLLDSAAYYAEKVLSVPLDYKKNFSYFRLAQVNLSNNDINSCLRNIDNSLMHYHKAKRNDSNFLAAIYSTEAKAHIQQQDFKKGLFSIQKALVINANPFKDTLNFYKNPSLVEIAYPVNLLNALKIKAQLLSKLSSSEKDQKAALETYQLAIQWIDTLQNSYVLEGSQLFWSKTYKEIYGEAIDLCYQFYQQTNDQQYLKLAFDIAEKSKALLLLEGIKDNEGKAVAGLPDSLIQKEKDLKTDLAFYEKSLQTAKNKKQEDRIKLYQSYLADTRLNLGNLKEQMEADFPDYFQLKYANTTISIPEIQDKLINQHSAFVEYFLGKSNAYAFVVGKNQQAFIRLDSVSTIQQKSKNFLEQLKNPAAVQQNAKLAYQDFNQAAYELYQVILAAVTKDFPSSIKHLIFAPDDILNNLPFEVLTMSIRPQPSMDFGSLPYLFNNYQIHYAYSANLLWKNQQRQSFLPTNTRCYAVAPPYKEKGKTSERGTLLAVRSGTIHLDGTGREIQGIANYFEGDYDSSSSASKANFLNNAPQYGLLHLAMHGEASGKDAAHLIFTNLETDSTNDHLLYHYEIANMDLTAQLAVLSACETGVGEYVQGEGVFSLARSFMYAGVPSLAMTLWKVNDGTTSVLMPYFYKNLSEGMSKSEALHTAKKHFSQNAGLEFRHPYYWSGFVLLGDGGALKMGNDWWAFGIGGLLLFFSGLLGFKWWKKS